VTDRAVKNLAAWSGCISGALQETEYAGLLKEAGFEEVEIRRTKVFDIPDALAAFAFPDLDEEERREIGGALASALIFAKKPSVEPIEGRDFFIRTAVPEDVPAIAALLEENGLSPLGVAASPENFLVLEQNGIAAVAGMEIQGDAGLLRSLAVRLKDRKKGFGERMTYAIIDRGREQGVRTVYLLTETAERFFGRAGFTAARREDIPAPLMQSSALDRVCPQGSTVMKKTIPREEN